MCGIVGCLAHGPVNQEIYDALTFLQHRGQDAAGIMTCDHGRLFVRKSNGLVRDAIREPHMRRLRGNMGLGHVRYPTAGSSSSAEAQPFYVNSPYGLSLVHNGNLTNADELSDDLRETDFRHLNTCSDSEVLLNVFAHELMRTAKMDLDAKSIFSAVTNVCRRVRGAYSAIAMINGYGLVAFRDPNGIRPLVFGVRQSDKGSDYMIASETIALDALGYTMIGDVKAGEAIYIDMQGNLHRHQAVGNAQNHPCLFEYIYLARPDSVIDNISVYKARLYMGKMLANKIQREHSDHDIDVVVPIPDTSRTFAMSLAKRLGVLYSEGFVKNRYIGRTFIMPGQAKRRSSVRMKLNAIKTEFRDKNVLLVDDSIVRGTTSKEIVQMARDAGAKKVYFASAAPEVRFPNVYGLDMPVSEELIAYQRDVEQISDAIGSDWLVFNELADICKAINQAVREEGQPIERFEDSIFTGDYVTNDVSSAYLDELAQIRNDRSKQAAHAAGEADYTELV